jgi:deoxyhypusine synthase
MRKKDLLNKTIEHIDIKAINSVDIINSMKKMSFSARDLANAADIYDRMLKEKNARLS